MQTIIAALIAVLALLYALYRIIRFFLRPDDAACNPEKCASCPYKSGDDCSAPGTGSESRRQP
ncbi:MAG TPA: hypothetical protein PK926_00700 [Spirochaetota bacterium]|nr:hypothetical protein [Spirochaetota bacterium]HPI87869.1 hypothetical protein [Spirochaetota bacterium]HPR47399.1 hypothetical protein [Spirochaetota bacterium]